MEADNGAVHVTDYTNASRTMLYNIRELKWDDKLLARFNIPRCMLPEVRNSSEIYGYVQSEGARVPGGWHCRRPAGSIVWAGLLHRRFQPKILTAQAVSC